MAIQELNQNPGYVKEELENKLFDEGVIVLEVPSRGVLKFRFGKHKDPGGFPYFVRIEIENKVSSSRGEFIPFGGVDSRSKKGVLNDLLVEWPHFSRGLFEKALAEKQ